MNKTIKTYTVSIDIAAPSPELAHEAAGALLRTEATVNTLANFWRIGECRVDWESLRVEKPEPALPKNCRRISVEEAMELYDCCKAGGYALNDGVLVTPYYHASRPILWSEFKVMFSMAGTYLCMDAESARLFHERVRVQNAHERVKTARGSVNDSTAVGAEGVTPQPQ